MPARLCDRYPRHLRADRDFCAPKHRAGTITLLPNLARSFERLGDFYGALVRRGAFPAADAISRIICRHYWRDDSCEVVNEEDTSESISTGRWMNAYPSVKDEMGQVAGGLEFPLALACVAPYTETSHSLEIETFLPGLSVTGDCIEDPQIPPIFHQAPSCCFEEDHYRKEFTMSNGFPNISFPMGGFFPQLIHGTSALATYVNFWGAPHWSYFLHFPIDAVAEGWTIPEVEEYWLPRRSQFVHTASLTSPDKRNHIVTEPLLWGTWQATSNKSTWAGQRRGLALTGSKLFLCRHRRKSSSTATASRGGHSQMRPRLSALISISRLLVQQ